ncbi:hypothetical protein BVY03_03235 [bacterium K02(2017)]|nr:hypothetical protein BVY03_03235 [bacterium K02(2017)]
MLYILPGMGADSKMYSAPWHTLPDTKFINWPQYANETTLKQIAQKLIDNHQIKSSDTIAGSSMGGMVALEIAAILKINKVILIGSAINSNEINSFLLSLAPLTKITPVKFIQALAGKSSNDVSQQFANTDPQFIKEMCQAIKNWQGVDFVPNELIRIHGEKDHIIACPENCFKINGAGHLVAMSHADECCDFLRKNNLVSQSKKIIINKSFHRRTNFLSLGFDDKQVYTDVKSIITLLCDDLFQIKIIDFNSATIEDYRQSNKWPRGWLCTFSENIKNSKFNVIITASIDYMHVNPIEGDGCVIKICLYFNEGSISSSIKMKEDSVGESGNLEIEMVNVSQQTEISIYDMLDKELFEVN